jgi:hypothetical protein
MLEGEEMKDEALKLALEALGTISTADNVEWIQHKAEQAITAIKQALAAPVQKGAIGAEYQKSPWDGKGASMSPPAAQQPDVDAMIALARADEREACAELADKLEWADNKGVASAIRNRGNT